MRLFSRHYGTERFFIMIFLCLALLVSLGSYGGMIQHQNNKEHLSSTAIYTPAFTWSRMTDAAGNGNGTVVGMLTDSTHTSVFVLLQNSGSAISYRAEDFQVFLTGRDKPLKNAPVMTTYVYGSTGYVGFLFKDARGFENQVYSMIVRNDSAASIAAGETRLGAEAARDTSFRDHNQIRLYLNFGASEVTVSDVMDDIAIDASGAPMKLIADLPLILSASGDSTSGRYVSSWKQAQDRLEDMSQDLMEITQARDNLTSMGIVLPDLPYYMAGDRVDTIPNDFTREPLVFTPDMVRDANGTGSGSNIMGVVPDAPETTGPANGETDGNNTAQGDASMGATFELPDNPGKEYRYYYLHTDHLYPGTVNFAYQAVPLSKGLISQIGTFRQGTTSLDQAYMNYQAWKASCDAYEGAMPVSVSYPSWRKADGTYVDMSQAETGGTTSEARVAKMCYDYTEAVNKYLADKKAFSETLGKMLDIENEVQALGGVVSTDNGAAKQNLWLY